MGIQVALTHETRYRYQRPVSLGPQTIQLRPAPHCRTQILSYSLDVTPADRLLSWQFDPLANHIARAIFPSKTADFVVQVNLVADLEPINAFAFLVEPGYATIPFAYSPELARDLEPFLPTNPSDPSGPLFRAFLADIPAGPQPTVNFLVSLNARVRDAISYTTRLEHGVQSSEETLSLRTGSCRDSAWLLVQLCRHLGIAARFVSGYLIQLADDHQNTSTLKKDSADLHAWAEVYLPGAGWIGMDPTSGFLTAECHIPLACSSTPLAAAPIGGTVEPAEVEFTHTLSIQRLNQTTQLDQPYTDQDWQQVRDLAHHIDRELIAQDVRLTMGGEPTFVSIDEPEKPQWNTEALGALKRTLGLTLLRSLRQRTAPGALLHFGQGKWYPGEPLPRWAFHCVSRIDGVPVWENGDLFALEDQQYNFTDADALSFIHALTRRLGVSAESILPAVEPFSDPNAPTEPTGYVLPLRRRQPDGRLAWSSQLWFDRPERFLLSPGDSPIGYRIPVSSMPWVAPDTLTYECERDAVGKEIPGRVKLPTHPARHPDLFACEPSPDTLPPIREDSADAPELIRPSLCVQVREGRLHVFLPYVSVLADYLDLVAAIEDTCVHLQRPIWIEGYTANHDPRIRTFSLTPDPGVLEVNLPPTANWDDLETLNAILAEEADKHRLIPGKFAYDGSHLATGGGSHITLGGPSVADSPVLRRPQLLRSMISFWQNHPSLSYLFSGMYVGPTSQYPRVDEARTDALYELELAFSHLPQHECPPHILDGLFRNLLVDVTGNAHRAEFCIDKLYPPEGRGLRIGLLELRAFEMAPDYRMGLLQMLLVRALVCLFWKQPYTGSLLRWGASLHDRFMLPHFVQRDFAEVLSHLRSSGLPFEDKWFAAHHEFRFPKIGSLTAEGVELELRQALEPWNVLAEETTSGGTGRSVDSSLERMQVKLSGDTTGSRYAVTCNGRRIPLHPTGHPGESVAGIRYRARRLSAELHPSIPVHTPLRFELIDTWKQRSIGSCIYYAGQPDGSLYTARPADAAEARARRQQRFTSSTIPSENIAIPADENNLIFPMTLDMRWPSPTELAQPKTSGLPSTQDKAPHA
jgi:uncharacterized protein (DUF2126 family)/transglutaminase-like putative cysteine protease